MRILIIEDEYNLAEIISERLKQNKIEVDIETNGSEGYYTALSNIYDLIILDVMLPDMDGFTILKELRNQNINSKIIMLTASITLDDKLNGLSNGANDYITKPFHMDELLARINIQLNGPNNKNLGKLIYGDIELDINKSTITCITTNETIDLVCKEFGLLEYFIHNPNQILSKEQIYDKIWGPNSESESNNLEAYLSFIRKKLKAIDSKVNIKSQRGLGYKMEYPHE